jgi:dihydrofolate reductase
MRKLRIFEHISVDGIIAPGGEHDDNSYTNGGWTDAFRSPDGAKLIIEAQGPRFDLLLGRHTYDLWSGYWPKQSGGSFATPINSATKYVATHRPESLTWGPLEAVGPDLIAGVHRMKEKDGPDVILWGSSTLTSPLLDAGVVDEVVLTVYPVLLGRGKRLFSDKFDSRRLELVKSQSTPTGVMLNTFKHVGKHGPA